VAGLQRAKVGQGARSVVSADHGPAHTASPAGRKLASRYAARDHFVAEISEKIFGETGGGEGCSITPRGKTSTLASG
jgi:hypothetical protein